MSGGSRWLASSFVRVACGVLAMLWADVRVARAADAADSTMDIVQYRAPAGWKATNANDAARRIYTSPDSTPTQQAVIMVTLAPPQNGLDLRTAFDGVVKQMSQSGKVTQSGELSVNKTRQGFEAMSQTMAVQAGDGSQLSLRLTCANVNNRLVTFCYLGTPAAFYDKHMAQMDDLLHSVSFAAGGGVAAAAAGNANAAAGEVAALEQEKQQLLTRVAAIDARLGQLKSGAGPAAAAAGPVSATGVPVRDEAAAIAQAAGQFNKTVNQRRKPHTIVGDILTLDGKPIPNVVTATVSVGGVSIAAERTHYTLAVDKAGHFEQKIPDGLYKLFPKVVVNLNGHQVPVDVVPIDVAGARVDQSSAEGIVQDFRLVLNALDPLQDPNRPESYLGGSVHVSDPTYTPQTGEISHRHPGAKIRFTFVPLTSAVDGSKIDPFAVDMEPTKVKGYGITRLPLAAYRVSAALAMPGGSTQPLTCSLDMLQNYGNAVELNWDGQAEYNTARVERTIYVRD